MFDSIYREQDKMIIVIPARGGSKRLPHKNIQNLQGKPLLYHTLDAIAASGLNCPVFVSTDDDHIACLASVYSGVKVIMRPEMLASDTASTESVLLHVLDVVGEDGINPKWLMTLPPTSPFRSPETIRRFAETVQREPDAQDCLMSTTENRGDFWQMKSDGTLIRLFPDAPRRQQERTPLFEENSAVYISRVTILRDTGTIIGGRIRGHVIPALEGFDINTAEDMKLANYIAEFQSASRIMDN
jgi:CMP-N-acetylneuraminic acid synthetase